MDPSATPSIPNYEILGRIGGGAYGEVYLARSVTGMYRAVKTVRREDFEYERTFEREFEGIQRYEQLSRDCPGLVDVLHVGRDDEAGFYFYVMELADDESGEPGEVDPETYRPRTLSSVLREGAARTVEQSVEWGIALAGGLGHLHQAGLTHRDVKPSNVIFVNGSPRLADIGLVAGSGQKTYVGTEGYVPPEGPGTSSADLYSLAMVLYELHTGKDRLEFPELPTNLEIPPTVNRDQWRALNAVICRAGSPDPQKRYDSAHSFALGLREAVGQDLPGRLSSPSSARTGGGRGWLMGLFLLLLLGGVGFGSYWIWNDYRSFLEANGPQIAGQGEGPGEDDDFSDGVRVFSIDGDPSDTTAGEDVDSGEGADATGTNEGPASDESEGDVPTVADEETASGDHAADGGTTDGGEAVADAAGTDPGESDSGEPAESRPNQPGEDLAADDGAKPLLVANVVTGEVKINSRPSGATVWRGEEEIGRTETPLLEFPVGPIELVFRHPDYLDTVHRGSIEEGLQQIEVELLEDRRPVSGSRWVNALGMVFVPGPEGAHRSEEPVSSQVFSLYLDETGRSVPLNGFGGFAGVRDVDARWDFCDWVTRRDRAGGFLGRDQYHRPVSEEGEIEDVFHCEVATEFGTLILNSEPEGARVTVNGAHRGLAPLVLNDVRFGPYTVSFDAPGYTPIEMSGTISGVEPIAIPVELEPDQSVVFGRPWTNSLGMELVPIDGLLVATREASVGEYRQFVTEAGSGVMPGVGFGQGLDHPVAGVTLYEARAFCEWLTRREQELGWIRPGQRYRLPGDREWTRFTGQEMAPGDLPEERGRAELDRFPWGDEWPPQRTVGNFADSSAAEEFGRYVIEGYTDGFPHTSPCGHFEPLANGLHDLSGNVWEWIDEPYGATGSLFVVRGGGWNSYDRTVLRTHYRNPVRPDARENHYGFRYVLEEVRAPR